MDTFTHTVKATLNMGSSLSFHVRNKGINQSSWGDIYKNNEAFEE